MSRVDAQHGPGRPINVADRWVQAVLVNHDLAAGWPLMDDALRRVSVRTWIDANLSHSALAGEDPGELCAALTVDDPTGHPLWGGYAIWQVTGYRKAWSHINVEQCGFASNPRPISLDLELVVFVDTGSPDPAIVAGPPEREVRLPGIGFVMRHLPEGGWVVQDFQVGESANLSPMRP